MMNTRQNYTHCGDLHILYNYFLKGARENKQLFHLLHFASFRFLLEIIIFDVEAKKSIILASRGKCCLIAFNRL